MKLSTSRLFAVGFGFLAIAALALAKDKKPKAVPKDPQDEIEVVGHIPLTHGVRRFVATQHYSSYYLYAESEAGKNVTLIDVTKAARPSVLADMSYPGNVGSENLLAVAGTAALVSEGQAGPTLMSSTQTIRIMNFADPLHPAVAREFAGVTAITRDDRRGLIFVANSDGLWILHERLAVDPEVEKAYEHHVIYDH